MSNKIAIVGVLDKDGSTNVFMAKAFMKKGFEVLPINYRTLTNQFGKKTAEKIIIEVVSDVKPDLTIFCKVNGLSSDTIGYCCKATKTYFWFPDPIKTLKQLPECLSHARMSDFVSCTGKGVAEYLRSQTGVPVHHVIEGIDPDYYCPQPIDKTHDVVFIGTRNEERDKYLKAIIEVGYSIMAYGNGYVGGEVEGINFCRACSSGKILLAVNNEHTTNEYFSDRVLRYGACGGFVLHSYSPNMEKYFIPNVDLAYFEDVPTLLASIQACINNDDMRNNMALSLRNKVLANYTWDTVVDKILSITGGGECRK